MTKRERGYLSILERRRKFLASRIMQGQMVGHKGIDYDRQELAALNWTLDIVRVRVRVDERDAARVA